MNVEEVGRALLEQGMTIAVAEADTAGLVGHLLCSVPGASRYFPGGVIAYLGPVKTRVLGVPEETIRDYGSVSREVALAMARGVRELLDTDLGVSDTGIAGPTGGTPEKPPGTFWIALVSRDGAEIARELRWNSNARMPNKERTAQAVIDLVAQHLGLA